VVRLASATNLWDHMSIMVSCDIFCCAYALHVRRMKTLPCGRCRRLIKVEGHGLGGAEVAS
jgi:hypothetical protein